MVVLGCQSTSMPSKRTEKSENYTMVVCNVKNQNIGSFSEELVFDKSYRTVSIGDQKLVCSSDGYIKCKANQETKNGYKFYTVSVYTYSSPASGYLNMAEIENNMLVDASYVELECNHQ